MVSRPLADCEGKVETTSGYVVRDWQPISQDFEMKMVASTFREHYVVSLRCSGYSTVRRSVASRNYEEKNHLGTIDLAPID